MAAVSGTAASRAPRGRHAHALQDDDDASTLSASDLAWLAALPCAAVTLLAALVLGPALGRALFPEGLLHFWPYVRQLVRPEPTEQARYLIALGAPLLLSAATLAGARRGSLRLPPAAATALVTAVQALGLLLLVACYVSQRHHVYGQVYLSSGSSPHTSYFTPTTVAVAGALAVGLALAVRSARVRAGWARLARETRARRIGFGLLALLAVGVWLLPAVNFDDTIVEAHPVVAFHGLFSFDETYAVLDGRSPLVDFAAQYGSLWPYALAGGMSLLGNSSLGTLTLLACAVTGLAVLALYDLLRRVTRSSLAAFALFLPLLATSFFMMRGPLENRYALVNLFGAFPLRYAGPLMVAGLAAWLLDGGAARRAWPLFVAAGLTLLNNADLGLAALGASVAAQLWTAHGTWRTWARTRRLVVEACAGVVGAFALVTLLTLIRTGELPQLELLFRYSRMFAVAGFGMLPIEPTLGLALVMYLTYVAAIATATVRAVRGCPDRVTTGLLAWSGIFGLGAGAYYVGRSHPEVLTNMFPPWALCLTLLGVVAIRAVAAADRNRHVTLAQLACLGGLGLMACSLAQTPTPWSQLDRLAAKGPPAMEEPAELIFVGRHASPGEPVALLMLMGHRLALTLGLDDVAPYTGSASIATHEQLDETVAALRRAGGRKLFLSIEDTPRELMTRLERAGFRRAGGDAAGTRLLVDAREVRR